MIGLLLAALAQDTLPPPRVVDDFASVAPWHAAAPEGVEARVSAAPGRTGAALRLDYRFHGAGYAIARRELPLTFPANYTLSFWLRSDGPPNTLEVKFVDASGENVWWYTERDRHFTGGWERITIRKRQVSFAWGPTPGPLTRSAHLRKMAARSAKGKVSQFFLAFSAASMAARTCLASPKCATPRLWACLWGGLILRRSLVSMAWPAIHMGASIRVRSRWSSSACSAARSGEFGA